MTVVETSTWISPRLKLGHGRVFLVGAHAAVQQANAQAGELVRAQPLVHLDRGLQFPLHRPFFDDGIDDVRLMSGGNLLAHELPHFVGALVADQRVVIGVRPGGSSSSTLVSRSP